MPWNHRFSKFLEYCGLESSMGIQFKKEMIIACGYYYQEKYEHVINF